MRSGMFTSVNGDRKYTSTFFAEYFASFIGNGVFPNPSTNAQVLAESGMNVSVQQGKAWIDGYILYVDNPQSLTLDTGDNLLPRIDKVVIRLDKINREIVLAVKKGTPATNPTAPNLQRNADVYELGIANIYVARAASQIIQANITDLRLNTSQCGIVKGLVDEVDTTTIFNQYQDWLNITTADLQQEFMDWFNELEDVLDENAAGNLLNMIDEHLEGDMHIPKGLISMWSGLISAIPTGWTLCNGENGTPNLTDRFIVGAGEDYEIGDAGGLNNVSLTTSQLPSHSHERGTLSASSAGSHTHSRGTLSTASTGSHTHSFSSTISHTINNVDTSGMDNNFGIRNSSSNTTGSSGAHSHTISGSTASGGSHSHSVTGSTGTAGSGSSHENRPPYFALAFIMKL